MRPAKYWDDYVRVGGEWCFGRRRLHRWYLVDALERPAPGAGLDATDGIVERRLPDAYSTWAQLWDTGA